MRILANCAIELLAIGLILAPNMMADEKKLSLTLRSRTEGTPEKVVEKKVNWEAGKTALIICDMWDDHWCKSAARRVGEMAGPMNEMVKAAREKGVLHHSRTRAAWCHSTIKPRNANWPRPRHFRKSPVPAEREGTLGHQLVLAGSEVSKASCRSMTPTWAAVAKGRNAKSGKRGRGRSRRSTLVERRRPH